MFSQRLAEPVASDSEIVRMPRCRLPGCVIPGDSLLGQLHWVEVVRREWSRVEYEPLSEAAGLADLGVVDVTCRASQVSLHIEIIVPSLFINSLYDTFLMYGISRGATLDRLCSDARSPIVRTFSKGAFPRGVDNGTTLPHNHRSCILAEPGG
jgi:hypothetical protein